MFASAFRALCQIRAGCAYFAAVITVPYRNSVTPPELSGNAPVMDVFKPLNVCLGETFRNKLCFAGCNGFHGRAGKRFHLDEPLLGCHRFYDRLAAGAVSDSMLCFFNLYQKTGILQILNDGFSGFITVHAVVLAGLFVHRAVLVHDDDGLKIVAASHLKVVRVMRRSNLDAACAVCHIYIIISNDRNFTVCCRKFYLLAYKMGISFIIWIDSNGCIPGIVSGRVVAIWTYPSSPTIG